MFEVRFHFKFELKIDPKHATTVEPDLVLKNCSSQSLHRSKFDLKGFSYSFECALEVAIRPFHRSFKAEFCSFPMCLYSSLIKPWLRVSFSTDCDPRVKSSRAFPRSDFLLILETRDNEISFSLGQSRSHSHSHVWPTDNWCTRKFSSHGIHSGPDVVSPLGQTGRHLITIFDNKYNRTCPPFSGDSGRFFFYHLHEISLSSDFCLGSSCLVFACPARNY